MALYPLLRPFLFSISPETSHTLSLCLLRFAHAIGLTLYFFKHPISKPIKLLGLEFPNAIGLAAGLDKNGEYIDALASLGFGYIEIGTVTPRPQSGNPKPRLFRLTKANAIINRMGFNNDGVNKLVENVRRSKYRGILGINIGKNADTPLDRAVDDYLYCLRKVYAIASYVTINISSPNTPRLRQLQTAGELDKLLGAIKTEQLALAQLHQKYIPIAVKIAPDLEEDEIAEIAEVLFRHKIDAVIATNTTLDRQGVMNQAHYREAGGLSGEPLRLKSTRVIRKLKEILEDNIPIIGVGGIQCADHAREKLLAGADLLQIYSGLIFRGPALVRELTTTDLKS